jgi:hypothetical protein
MKQAILYKKMKNNLVQCEVCAHQCVIAPQKRGICSVRENQGGKLYSLNYEKAIALNIDPVEKNLYFIFYPALKYYLLAQRAVILNAFIAKIMIFLKVLRKTKKLKEKKFPVNK